MGGAVSTGIDNDDLIDNLINARYIKTRQIEKVFRAVDRARYFLPDFQVNAYKDLAWKSGNIHISAPCIYSVVMENLELTPGLSFLNIGSGTGYLSTMVGLLLGPCGVNHGIEIFGDVIKYANEKLIEFKRNPTILDYLEFCEPTFVEGNGLCLPSDMHQYDRVYCGAACPNLFENYMKNLIKVGGVLVMPHNDQLLQITRLSETKWSQKSLLPVSFSILQLPTVADSKETIVLPITKPVSLQSLCRFCILHTLHRCAEQEHPELIKPQIRKLNPRKRRVLRSFVIPFLESSDDESDSFHSSVVIGGGSRITAFLDIHRQGTNSINERRTMLVQRSRPAREPTEPFSTCSTSNDEEELEIENTADTDKAEVAEAAAIPQRPPHVPKREKFDSGIVDDLENENDDNSSDEDIDRANVTFKIISDEETVEMQSDVDFDTVEKSDDEGVEEDSFTPKKDCATTSNSENKEPQLTTFRSVMEEKIMSLPLPHILKSYLNFYRDFL